MSMKKLVALAAALLLMILAAAGAMAATSAVNDARNGVVYIQEFIEFGTQIDGHAYTEIEGYHGSAFFIDPQYLVTCAHCVENYMNIGKGEAKRLDPNAYVQTGLRVFFDENDYVEAYVVDYDRTADIAILRIEEPTDKRKAMKLKTPTHEMVGDVVYALGYPSMAKLTVAQGVIRRVITNSKTGVREVQTDTAITHSNAGGPMVHEKGFVVGINANGYDDVARSYNYAVNIAEIIDMCNRNNIPYALGG